MELWQYDATDLARLIRTGQASAREAVDSVLGRLHKVNPAINAVVRVLESEARAEAETADAARARGHALPPLHAAHLDADQRDVRPGWAALLPAVTTSARAQSLGASAAFIDALTVTDGRALERNRARLAPFEAAIGLQWDLAAALGGIESAADHRRDLQRRAQRLREEVTQRWIELRRLQGRPPPADRLERALWRERMAELRDHLDWLAEPESTASRDPGEDP